MIKQTFFNFAIPDGLINVDSEFAKEIDFTTEAGFSKDSYMWGFPQHNGIVLSLIICRKKGGFKQLMQNIEKNNLIFRIPTPSDRMLEIGRKQGWSYGTDGEITFLTNEKKIKR